MGKGVPVDGITAPPRLSPLERLALHSQRDPETGCLVFTGASHDRMGYGRMGINKRMRYVHRVAFEIAHGQIPEGMIVRHTCDNPPCIEPEHLILGTQADNVRDMFDRNRVDRRGERNNSARLDWETVRAIRKAWEDGVPVKEIATVFQLSKSQVRNVTSGRHWKES